MEIGGKKVLRQYYSVLYRLTGVIIDFVSADGAPLKLCEFERYNEFCKLVQASPEGHEACRRCDQEADRRAREDREGVIYECHAGLVDISVPLFAGQEFLGCLTTGQLLSASPSEAGFAGVLERLRGVPVDHGALRRAYFATPFFAGDRLAALVELIGMVGNYMAESENKLLFLESFDERDRITALRRHVERHYGDKLTVAAAAAFARLSPSHFSHLFKKEVGSSFVQYLNRFRIDEAAELLLDSDMAVGEVAEAVGFQSLPHFNRIFRKLRQQSPSAFRKAGLVKHKAGKA